MRKVLADEWGAEPEQVLARDRPRARRPQPASARSTAAAPRTAREVAVKVQYPGIAEAVESDMRNLRLLSPLLRRLMPGLEVKDVLAELRERIVEECDYELEAAQPPPRRPLLARPPVRPRARGRHRAQPPPGAGHRVGRRDRLRRGRRASPTTSATATPRSSTASSTAPRSSSASRSATRTRATTCSATTAGSPSSTSGCSAGCPPTTCAARRVIVAAIRDGDEPALLDGDARRSATCPASSTEWDGDAPARAHARGLAGGFYADEPLPPRARGPLARHRVAARGRRRRADRAAAPDDAAARGPAAAADGGPAVPDRVDAPRRRALGRPAPRADRGRRARGRARRASTPPGSPRKG